METQVDESQAQKLEAERAAGASPQAEPAVWLYPSLQFQLSLRLKGFGSGFGSVSAARRWRSMKIATRWTCVRHYLHAASELALSLFDSLCRRQQPRKLAAVQIKAGSSIRITTWKPKDPKVRITAVTLIQGSNSSSLGISP